MLNLSMDTLAQFITHPNFKLIWCAMIALYGIRWLVTLEISAFLLFRQFSISLKTLRKESWEEASQKILKLSRIKKVWTRLLSSVKDGMLTRSSDDFLNEDELIQPSIDTKFYASMASQLTGLGILGTFIGLAAGIYLSKDGLTHDSMKEVQNSLTNLLGGAALAFWTSIAGLFCSLVYTKFEKETMKRLRKKVLQLRQEVDSKISLLDSAHLFQVQIECLKQQTEATVQMQKSLQALASQNEVLCEKSLLTITTEFRTALTGACGQDIQNIALAFKNIKEAVGSLENHIKDASSLFKKETAEASEFFNKNLETTMQKISHELMASVESSARFTAEQLDQPSKKFLNQIGELTLKTTEALSQWSMVISTNNTNLEQVVAIHKNLTELMDPITQSIYSMNHTYKNSQEIFARSSHMAKNIFESVSKMEMINTQLSQLWDSYSNRFDKTDQQLKNVIFQTNSSLENYSERLKGFTSDLDRQMSKGMLTLAGAVGDLHQVVGSLPKVFKDARP